MARSRCGERDVCTPRAVKKENEICVETRFETSVILVASLLLPLVGLVAQEASSLLIEGPQGQTRVIQVQGKNYAEVDQLARITG